MKICLYEVLNAMDEFRDTLSTDSEELAQFLQNTFNVPVSDEGLLEATFVQFCVEYCG